MSMLKGHRCQADRRDGGANIPVMASIAWRTGGDAQPPSETSSALVWSSLRVRPCSFGSTILCSDSRVYNKETSRRRPITADPVAKPCRPADIFQRINGEDPALRPREYGHVRAFAQAVGRCIVVHGSSRAGICDGAQPDSTRCRAARRSPYAPTALATPALATAALATR